MVLPDFQTAHTQTHTHTHGLLHASECVRTIIFAVSPLGRVPAGVCWNQGQGRTQREPESVRG